MNGVIVIDKHKGPTSHDVVAEVKRRLNLSKAGHLGTLDPSATGVLPVVTDGATKLARFLEGDEKGYTAAMKLGEETDTYDADGKVIGVRDTKGVTEEAVLDALASFRGRILQTPPMFSSVKLGGRPLYRLARKGITVERASREVEIYSIEAVEIDIPRVVFRVLCTRGTYIRTLVHDIGARLGCGAHLTELRRFKSGVFTLERAVGLHEADEVLKGAFIPVDEALGLVYGELRTIQLDEREAERVRNGNPAIDHRRRAFFSSLRDGEMVRFMHRENLLAIASFRNGAFKVERVFV